MSVTDVLRKSTCLLVAWSGFFIFPMVAQAGAVENGNQAYRAGNYQQALTHYQQAIEQGNRNPTVQYNKGVAHYKLGQWQQANTAFEHLLQYSKWESLAYYNLGRLAEEKGQTKKAKHLYEKTLETTDNDRLRTIASRKIASFQKSAAARKPSAKKSAALVSIGLNYDDNATGLADELASRSSGTEDTYLSLLAYGQHYLQGKAKEGVKLYGLTQARRFETFESFNTLITGIGLNVESPWREWHTDIGARVLVIQVDDNRLANQLTGTGKIGSSWADGYLEAEYQLSYFIAGDQYEHLDGWQQKISLSWKKTLSNVTVEPVIAWTHNSREDKETNDNFYSYSFNKLGVGAKVKTDLDKQWRLYGDFTLATAFYENKNRLNDLGGSLREAQRENSIIELTLGTRYRLAEHWYVKAELTHKDVDDTFGLYTYSKNRLSFKLDYQW